MISDENDVSLEGTIYETPEVYEPEGKKVINFAVRNVHISANGEEDEQIYNSVMWNKAVDKYADLLKENAYVRIRGHLQNNTLMLEGGKKFRYSKVCVDRLEVEE